MKTCCKYLKQSLIFLLVFILISLPVSADILQQGDRGDQVEQMQAMLDGIGYDVNVDGIFGPWTERAVKDFQYNNNLRVDGIAGSSTIEKLENMQGEVEYTVEWGDSLSQIAVQYNVSVSEIKERNNLNSETLIEGQKLKIPVDGVGGVGHDQRSSQDSAKNYIVHQVESGEALSLLAHRYGTSMETIKLANNLQGNRIYQGQELIIPRDRQSDFSLDKNSLIWPVTGRISSPFGYRSHPVSGVRDFHSGIDIAVPAGTTIRAAASGTVEESSWLGGYGKTVIIRHSDNVTTLYAHNSTLLVTEGEEVQVGDPISRAGSTGVSTGPHLHFEVQVNGEVVNPRDYLP